jgi:phosphoglycolate phosphatase
MVGDSRSDVLTARRAGAAVVLVGCGYTDGVPPERPQADAVVDDFSELLEVLPRLLLRPEDAGCQSPDRSGADRSRRDG